MAEPTAVVPGRRRLILGCVLLAASLVPWAVVPLAPMFELPASQLASLIAALLIGAEIVGAVAIAVLGREAYTRITTRFRRSKNMPRDASSPSTGSSTRNGNDE